MTKSRFFALTLLIAGSALAFFFTGMGTGLAPDVAVDTAPVQIADYWSSCHDICTNEQDQCLQGCPSGDFACSRECLRVYLDCSAICDGGCSPAHPEYPLCY